MPRKLWPSAIEREYATALRALTTHIVAPALAGVVKALPPLVLVAKNAARGDSSNFRIDAGEAKRIVDAAYAQMMSRLQVKDIANLANKYAQSVSGHNRRQLGRQLEAVFGVPVSIPDARTPRTIDAFIDQNVSLVIDNIERLVGNVEKDITRLLASSRIDADLATLINVSKITRGPEDLDAEELGNAIEANVALGGSNRQLAEEIENRFGFAQDHAEFIARDQVGTLNGQLDAQRQVGLGVSRFIWRTVGDERVRDEHVALDGETFSYDDPPDEGLPGEPINCRCSAEPVLDDIFDELDAE